jgi:uncharacterized small protein (DUF1192 family)
MLRGLILFWGLALNACSPQPQTAPEPAAAAKAGSPAPIAPLSVEELNARAAARDADIARLMKTAAPYQRGGRFGLVLLTPQGAGLPDAVDEAAWAPIAARLQGRFGPLTRLTPMQVELAQSPDLPAAAPAEAIRRAGAMQRLDYILIYRVELSQMRTGGALDRGRANAAARVEASVLDVASGGLIASASASAQSTPGDKRAAPDSARAAALAALGPELEAMARDLDAQAMRAAAGGQ